MLKEKVENKGYKKAKKGHKRLPFRGYGRSYGRSYGWH